eukprot:2858571-Pyramimonas_sp.AAC.2
MAAARADSAVQVRARELASPLIHCLGLPCIYSSLCRLCDKRLDDKYADIEVIRYPDTHSILATKATCGIDFVFF